MLLYADMCSCVVYTKPDIDSLLFKTDNGSITMGIAAIKHYITSNDCAPVCTKNRFRRLVEIASSQNSVISSAAMDVLHDLLVINKLDDFEKKQLYQIALGIAAKKESHKYMVRYGWANSIVLDCTIIYRECFIGGIIGAFVGNASAHGFCDPNIRGLKVFIETVVANNGIISKKQFYDNLDNMRMLLGYPSDLLLSSFVGFSHIKHHGHIGNIVDSLSRVSNNKNLVIAKAIRYAIKTSDMMFETYSFIENISQDAPIELYLDLKLICDARDVILPGLIDGKNPSMQPLTVAVYAFCKEPDNFARCIEECKNKLSGNDLSTATTIAGMLSGCRTGNVPKGCILWNGQDIYGYVARLAEKMFELVNTHKIVIS